MSAKAVTKKKAKKSGGKGSSKKAVNGPENVAVTREKVSHVIAAHAPKMTEAMAAEAEKGHLATFKYLFELLGIYPASTVEPEAEDSNDLARVLLNRFDFPYKGPGDEEAAEGPKDGELIPARTKDDSVE